MVHTYVANYVLEYCSHSTTYDATRVLLATRVSLFVSVQRVMVGTDRTKKMLYLGVIPIIEDNIYSVKDYLLS
jgi:hypothetical protein